ncbi:MAG: metallophosphoesterase family protein [Deltaproteobacteria bacterium]
MRYAVISDIHSNLEALAACVKEIDGLKIDRIISCGDTVGYNANPNECVDIMRSRKIASVMGNHDSRAAGLQGPEDFNLLAATAIRWTRDALTKENSEFLRGLPLSLAVDKRFLVFHGWLDDHDRYMLGARDAGENFRIIAGNAAFKDTKICFFGHTHVPVAYLTEDGSVAISTERSFKINKDASYLINPGGLGQPRDRDPRASFVVYDAEKSTITFHRVEYDIQLAAEKIIGAGLPERIAERLKLGW